MKGAEKSRQIILGAQYYVYEDVGLSAHISANEYKFNAIQWHKK